MELLLRRIGHEFPFLDRLASERDEASKPVAQFTFQSAWRFRFREVMTEPGSRPLKSTGLLWHWAEQSHTPLLALLPSDWSKNLLRGFPWLGSKEGNPFS